MTKRFLSRPDRSGAASRPRFTTCACAAILAIAACRDDTGTPPDQTPVQVPRVESWTLPLPDDQTQVRAAGDLVVYTVDSSVAAVDSRTGREVWRTAFLPPTVGLSALGNTVRVAESVRGTFDRVTFLDAASGQRLFTTTDVAERQRRLIGTSASELRFLVSDTGLLVRERTTGATARSISIPPAPPRVLDPTLSYQAATSATDELVYVWFNRGRTSHHFLRVAADGAPFISPFSLATSDTVGSQLLGAAVDPSNTRLFVTATSIAAALDVRSGGELWSTRFAPRTGNSLPSTVLAHYVTGGSEPVVHIIYRSPGSTPAVSVLRETAVRLASGDIVRDQVFGIESFPAQPIYPCGSDGLVQLTGGPAFTYTDSRTGKRASALVVNASGETVSLTLSSIRPALTFSTGWIVVDVASPRRLVGFRCVLATQ